VNQSTPLAIDGILYSSSPMSTVSAIDGATGKTLWTYDPKAYIEGTPPNLGFISRGLTYWAKGKDKRILVGTGDGYLIVLNAATGKPIATWGDKGRIDLTKGLRRFVDRSLIALTSPPIICGDTVIPSLAVLDSFAIGRAPMKYHPPGDIQAFDIKTGKRVWHFEQPPQAGSDGATKPGKTIPGRQPVRRTCGRARVATMSWGSPICRSRRPPTTSMAAIARVTTCSPNRLWQSTRRSGKIVWYQQIVRHGLWDYDLPTAPNLMDLTVNGKKIKALAQVTKQGFVFTFDRTNGNPVWPIEEKAVPQSTVPGERSATTQRFPSLPAPFVQQGVTEDDLINLTPQLKEEAKKILARYNYGPLYYPPTLDKAGTLQVPGVLGGASWVGALRTTQDQRDCSCRPSPFRSASS
jgi:quinoprotein glucose dehydrogenase